MHAKTTFGAAVAILFNAAIAVNAFHVESGISCDTVGAACSCESLSLLLFLSRNESSPYSGGSVGLHIAQCLPTRCRVRAMQDRLEDRDGEGRQH